MNKNNTVITAMVHRIFIAAEKRAMSQNHEYIGTDHMLYAILEQKLNGASLIVQQYASLDVLLHNLNEMSRRGPDMVTMGLLPQTPALKRALDDAMSHCRSLNYVTEYMLLHGLLKDKDGLPATFLQSYLDIEVLRHDLQETIKRGMADDRIRSLFPTPKEVCNCVRIAARHGEFDAIRAVQIVALYEENH